MGFRRGPSRKLRAAVATTAVALATAGSAAAAFQALPPGDQVNDDPAAGINKALSVNGEDPTNADVVGGALVAGKPAVPWAIFRQTGGRRAQGPDLLAARSPAGAWTTRGNGTVGGRSSASPDVHGLAELRPGPGRRGAGDRLRRRRPDGAVGDLVRADDRDRLRRQQHLRQPLRQHRRRQPGQVDLRRPGPRQRRQRRPRSVAEHPHQPGRRESVGGGRLGGRPDRSRAVGHLAGARPPARRPARTRSSSSRPMGPGTATATASRPTGVADGTGHVPAIGGFCFQQTGIPRVGHAGADPSLNVDPTRDGIEPDIAFTGTNDSVPWVVWYETGRPGDRRPARQRDGVRGQGRSSDGVGADGGFHWIAVGNRCSGDARRQRPTNHFGACAVGDRRGAVLAQQGPGQGRRGPAGRGGHDEPGQPDRPVGRLGRGRSAAYNAGVRARGSSAPARRALRDRQRRQPDLERHGRLDPPRHHVLGQHAVRVVA